MGQVAAADLRAGPRRVDERRSEERGGGRPLRPGVDDTRKREGGQLYSLFAAQKQSAEERERERSEESGR